MWGKEFRQAYRSEHEINYSSDLEKDRMSGRSSLRGHDLIWIGDVETGKWVYKDTGNDIPANGGKPRPCKKCGALFPVGEGIPDPCLGRLPGVNNACCGHGNPKYAYIRFTNGIIIEGFDIIKYSGI